MELKEIKGKYILLDAGVIMMLVRSTVVLEEFKNFFISQLGCSLVTIPSVLTEFINGAARDSDIEGKFNTNAERLGYALKFLGDLKLKELPISEERSDFAKTLSIINSYALCNREFDKSYKQMPQPSFVDLTIGAMSFQVNLIFATLNHKDFPPYLYDRLALHSFAENNSVKTIGFYKISESKYANLIQNASKQIKNINDKRSKKAKGKK